MVKAPEKTDLSPVRQRPVPAPNDGRRRAFWIRQTILLHWTSSAMCLGAMLLFTLTGITLNHAAEIPSIPSVQKRSGRLPPEIVNTIKQGSATGKHPLPAAVSNWLQGAFGAKNLVGPAEWSESEVYISLPKPGGDGWITINRETGEVEWEKTDRGWIAYLNDVHKGRHTGPAWQIFIDVIAGAFLVFTATGLILLQIHSSKRPFTWPAIALSFVAPVLVLLFFVHR